MRDSVNKCVSGTPTFYNRLMANKRDYLFSNISLGTICREKPPETSPANGRKYFSLYSQYYW